MTTKLPPNVHLDPPGEPPRWNTGGGSSPIDNDIRAARDAPLEDQRFLFVTLANQLYTTAVLSPGEFDHSNDEQWLTNLATWLRWPDALRDDARTEAMRSAMTVKRFETEGED